MTLKKLLDDIKILKNSDDTIGLYYTKKTFNDLKPFIVVSSDNDRYLLRQIEDELKWQK